MDLNKCIIDNRSLGKTLIACNVKPVYQYQDGKRISDEVIQLRYDVVCVDLGFEKIGVKIDVSANTLEVSEENPIEVEFDDLVVRPVWTPNGYIVSATAKGIRAVES